MEIHKGGSSSCKTSTSSSITSTIFGRSKSDSLSCKQCGDKLRTGSSKLPGTRAKAQIVCSTCLQSFCKYHTKAICYGCEEDGQLARRLHDSSQKEDRDLKAQRDALEEEVCRLKEKLVEKENQLKEYQTPTVDLPSPEQDLELKDEVKGWQDRALEAERRALVAEAQLEASLHRVKSAEARAAADVGLVGVGFQAAETRLKLIQQTTHHLLTTSSTTSQCCTTCAALRTTLIPLLHSSVEVVDEASPVNKTTEMREMLKQDSDKQTDFKRRRECASSEDEIRLLVDELGFESSNMNMDAVVQMLENFARQDVVNRQILIRIGGLESLANLLRDDIGAPGQNSAARLLSNLAVDAENTSLGGGVTSLVEKVKVSELQEDKESASFTLGCLAVLGRKENRKFLEESNVTEALLEQAFHLSQWIEQAHLSEEKPMPDYVENTSELVSATPHDAVSMNDCLVFWQNCQRFVLRGVRSKLITSSNI